ncbi:hypothetical protein SteCoe_3350 [Stentor coeruleus]|uniref:LNR domain-containing protein n=1 Tax=Stentor coeruleus TaxID=5963 RepID=A0A1R2CXF8_9CILI|nr:hypothetical protein SteCoe_3350 [Stentor coeruleus]
MLFILYVFLGVNSIFKIHSPDSLSLLHFDIGLAAFGSPGLYSIYGKITEVRLNNCKPTKRYSENIFPLVLNYPNCYYSELAYEFYISGAKLIILVSLNDTVDYVMIPKNYSEPNNYNIVTLMIPRYIYTSYFAFFDSILASYTYDIIQTKVPQVQLVISGYYEIDENYIQGIKYLYDIFNISWSNFEFSILYLNYSENMSISQDCITHNSNYYCSYGTEQSNGSTIINNSILSLSFYNSISSSDTPLILFLEYLIKLIAYCSNNYTLSCSQKIAEDFGYTSGLNYDLLETQVMKNINTGFYIINNIEYYWSDLWLNEIYCLSSENPNNGCINKCDSKCEYKEINSGICYNGCNSSSCGYSQLACLEIVEDCYYFMISDGNCNAKCLKESDCEDQTGGSFVYVYIILVAILFPITLLIVW